MRPTHAGFFRSYKFLVPIFSRVQRQKVLRNWTLAIGIRGAIDSDSGMVMNLPILDEIVDRIVIKPSETRHLKTHQIKAQFMNWVSQLQSALNEHKVQLLELNWGPLCFDGTEYSQRKTLTLATKCFRNSQWMVLPIRVRLWQRLLRVKEGSRSCPAGYDSNVFREELDLAIKSAVQLQDMAEINELCRKHSIMMIEARSEDRSFWIQAIEDFAPK